MIVLQATKMLRQKRNKDGTLTSIGHAGAMQKAGEAAKMEIFAAQNMDEGSAETQNKAIEKN